MSQARTVVFAGGGTAGHVFPSLAVADAFKTVAADVRPVFIGTRDRLEGHLVPSAGYSLNHIDVLPLPRRPSPTVLRVPGALRAAVRRCEQVFADERAVAAVTFGGYVSFPVSWACGRRGLPLVIHEQNSVPGLANRFAARWADRIAVTFPGSAHHFSRSDLVAVTGNPVRSEMLALDADAARSEAVRHFRLHQRRRTVLVFGGSQGARSVNRAAVASYPYWQNPDRVQILHAAGESLYRETAAAWEQARGGGPGPHVRCIDFIDDMAAAYAAADVVVCRAGATSIAELTAIGKPAVLVPYPHATANHQLLNARALERAGAACVIEDDDLSGSLLAATTGGVLDDEVQARMAACARAFGRRDAARNVARLVLEVVADRQPPGAAEPVTRADGGG